MISTLSVTNAQQGRNRHIGIAGCFLFALLSLGFAVHETRTLLHLLEVGRYADAVVVDIDVGAKGSKRAVFEFTTESGESVTARDLFQILVIRHHRGDAVVALYDPSDPKMATIDTGRWLWQEPIILYFSAAFMLGLGVLIYRHRAS